MFCSLRQYRNSFGIALGISQWILKHFTVNTLAFQYTFISFLVYYLDPACWYMQIIICLLMVLDINLQRARMNEVSMAEYLSISAV